MQSPVGPNFVTWPFWRRSESNPWRQYSQNEKFRANLGENHPECDKLPRCKYHFSSRPLGVLESLILIWTRLAVKRYWKFAECHQVTLSCLPVVTSLLFHFSNAFCLELMIQLSASSHANWLVRFQTRWIYERLSVSSLGCRQAPDSPCKARWSTVISQCTGALDCIHLEVLGR